MVETRPTHHHHAQLGGHWHCRVWDTIHAGQVMPTFHHAHLVLSSSLHGEGEEGGRGGRGGRRGGEIERPPFHNSTD